MSGSKQKLNKGFLPVFLVLVLALGYLAYLVSTVPRGVFYSADAGVKYMVVKQLTEGYGFKYLHLAQPSWVQSIWQAGYFPLRPPFVYPSSGGYLFVFPPAFQIASAFLYADVGYPGLYILPVLSIVALWVFMILLLRRLGIAPGRIALALFLLAFCSPLTLYGAMYWEHAPATLLLFAGLVFIVRPPARIAPAICLGLASGLAVWLRPEAMMMNFLYGLAGLVLYQRDPRRVYLCFVACLLLSVVSFMVFNQIEYGNIMGLHGHQLADQADIDDRWEFGKAVYNLWMNNYKSIRHFGFILLFNSRSWFWGVEDRGGGHRKPGRGKTLPAAVAGGDRALVFAFDAIYRSERRRETMGGALFSAADSDRDCTVYS